MLKEKDLEVLDFYKVLYMLKNEGCCKGTKNAILNLKPILNYYEVVKELKRTNDAYKLIFSFGLPPIQPIPDINSIVNRAKLLARLTANELITVANLLNVIAQLIKWKRSHKVVETNLCDVFLELVPLTDLKNKINKVILSEDEIADDASEELFLLREKIRNNRLRVRETLNKLISSPAYQKCLQEPIVTIRDGRFVVPVKSEYKSEIKGLVHDSSISGSTLFIEPLSVIEANNEIRVLEGKEKKEIEKIFDELSANVNEYIDEIARNYNVLITIDLYFAKAKLGCKMNAVIPNLNNVGKINLIKARHPLIEADKIVPININLGYGFDSLVITGPNTGGKTVALKTVGLLTLMAMSGLMVPASDESELSVFSEVLVDIGDEQSIEQNLSTFSSHMTNIISILNSANSSSLVLIDELGAGTDPVEGASLAMAILDELKAKNSKIIATTHYSEIKLYALKTERVENASCEFDVKTLKPTYKLSVGTPGKSNAFLISKKLGLNEDILNKAKLLIGDNENKFEDVISNLENSRKEVEEQKKEILKLKQSLIEDRNKIKNIIEDLEKRQNLEIEQAKKEAKKMIQQTREKSEAILEEIEKALQAKNSENFYKLASEVKSTIKSKFKKLDNISDSVLLSVNTPNLKTNTQINKKIELGDSVKILNVNQIGTVVSNPDKNGYVFVQTGNIKTKTHLTNLTVVKTEKNTVKSVVVKNIKSKLNSKVESEIHLRGMTVEEAVIKLDKFIDDSIIMGLTTVRIVHGKGTGILRMAVADYLRNSKSVKNFRLGVYGEGEDGVTIVTLKI